MPTFHRSQREHVNRTTLRIPLPFAAFVIVLLPFASQATAQSTDEFDLERLNGRWKADSARLGGQDLPQATVEQLELKIEGDKYEVVVGGIRDAGRLEFNTESSPFAINIIGEEGPNRGQTLPAIFKLEDGKLVICYETGGAERPAEFASPEGSQRLLIRYQKQSQ